MNLAIITQIFRGGNVYQTLAKLFNVGGGVIAGLDADDTGTDDIIAGLMLSAADGLDAYGQKDYNTLGLVIDAAIATLQKLKVQLTRAKLITRIDNAAEQP